MFIACVNRDNDSNFFSEYKDLGKNPDNRKILAIDSEFTYKNFPAYRLEFNSWKGILVNDKFVGFIPSLNGYIYYKNNGVYYMKNIEGRSIHHALLFDFNSKLDSIVQLNCYFANKSFDYKVQLENIFIQQKDSIYKFKFFNVGKYSSDNMDLVCYVNKLRGVLGMYISYYNSITLKDEVVSEWGELFDKSQLVHFTGDIK